MSKSFRRRGRGLGRLFGRRNQGASNDALESNAAVAAEVCREPEKRGWLSRLFGGRDGGQDQDQDTGWARDPALDLLDKDVLSAEEIEQVRRYAETLDGEERAAVYEEIAEAVSYRNQRNNVGEHAGDGDYMCNWTSIAMALNQLGIGLDESQGQMEDLLDAEHQGSRYDRGSRGAFVEEKFGLAQEWKTMQFSGASGLQKWFQDEVEPRLRAGEAAVMGNPSHSKYPWNHIVRIEWVDGNGITVDDPFGRASWDGSKYDYAGGYNDTESEEGVGADNHWSWEMFQTIATSGGSYVHFFGHKQGESQ